MTEQKTSLYELTVIAKGLVAQLIESGGELTPEIEANLTANELAVAKKVDGYVYFEEQLEMQAKRISEREVALRNVRKGLEAAQERLRGNVKAHMLLTQKTEVNGDEFRYKLSQRKPKPVVTSFQDLPSEFKIVVQEVKVDTQKLSVALRDGVQVPGAQLEDVYALLTQERTDS